MFARAPFAVLLAVLAGAPAGASGSKLSTLYRDAEYAPTSFEKVIVVVLSPDADLRRRAESGLARRMRSAVSATTFMPDVDLADREAVRRRVEAGGFDGALLVRPGGVDTDVTVGDTRQVEAFGGMWDFWQSGWNTVTLPGHVNIEKIVTVEAAVYSVTSGKLVWAGRMTSSGQKSLRVFLDDFVKDGAQELKKQRVI